MNRRISSNERYYGWVGIVKRATFIVAVFCVVMLVPSIAFADSETWTNVGLRESSVTAIAISSTYPIDGTLFAGTKEQGVYKSEDWGKTWSHILESFKGDQTQTTEAVTSVSLSPNYHNDHTVFVGNQYGFIYYSNDSGSNWAKATTNISTRLDNAIKNFFFSPDYANDFSIYASAQKSGIIESASQGKSWTRIDSGFNTDQVLSVVTSPDYKRDGLVLVGTLNAGLYQSSNSGASWKMIKGGFDANTIAFSPNYADDLTLYVGLGSGGVYKSSSTAEGYWQRIDNGFENMNVTSIALTQNYSMDGLVYVGTDGAGIYKSADQGKTWEQIDNGLDGKRVKALVISPDFKNDKIIYAATNAGVYSTQIASDINNTSIFTDMSISQWSYNYVLSMMRKGVVNGYADRSFKPDNNVTRAEFAKMIVLASGKTALATDTVPSFSDVLTNNWALTYVETAKNQGIINGYAGGDFRPNSFITRAEMAAMIVRAGGFDIRTIGTVFIDVPETNWAYASVMTAMNQSIISGYPGNKFAPDQSATRAEAAKMLSVMMNKLGR